MFLIRASTSKGAQENATRMYTIEAKKSKHDAFAGILDVVQSSPVQPGSTIFHVPSLLGGFPPKYNHGKGSSFFRPYSTTNNDGGYMMLPVPACPSPLPPLPPQRRHATGPMEINQSTLHDTSSGWFHCQSREKSADERG